MPPGAGERGQAGDVAHRHAATGAAVEAVVEPDETARAAPVFDGEAADGRGGEAGERRRPLRRAGAHARGKPVEAQGVAGDVLAVEQALGDQHLHHRERERAVGAGQRGEVEVALLRGVGAARVDAHQAGAAPLRLLQVAPAVQVGDHRVGPPDEDQAGLGGGLGVGAEHGAHGGPPAVRAGGGADRAFEQGRAEAVEEAPIQALALHQAHGAAVAVGQDRARVLGGDVAVFRRDGVERLVPGDALEAALALAPHPLHRMQQAAPGIHALEVVGDLGAQRAVGEGHVGRAADLHRAAVGDRDLHRAGVGAVVRAGRTHADFGGDRRGHRDLVLRPSGPAGPHGERLNAAASAGCARTRAPR